MDKPHKQVITTYHVAIKFGQPRVQIQNLIPWHASSEAIKCLVCETVYLGSEGFAEVKLLTMLESQHDNQEAHPTLFHPTRIGRR
jgi:hypothetical protein